MEKIFFSVLFLLFGLSSWGIAQPLSTPLKIAIVDIHYLVRDSQVAKQVNEVIEKKRKQYYTEMFNTEQLLRQTYKDLQSNQAHLPKTEFALARQDFENRLIRTQRLLEEQKQELEVLQTEANKIIYNKINEIISRIFTQKTLNLIISKDHVILYSETLDITEEVMNYLNNELPFIDFSTIQPPKIHNDFLKEEESKNG